ncbi:hypothetical protein FQ082_06840 [Psychrobacter sp. ANT_H56B]|uniref:hypothetical protein n=1 Tax=Psychrobacter sp. ANT_H56B TaxID=2597353 RepID=UPI0011F219D4|nr:hypothetical protein [Psychrobacter sp. ANT_H56B]KAA0926854.1 hypothetical protein FQ082_06840 [Psychrobacter sp. ANT_H56B]
MSVANKSVSKWYKVAGIGMVCGLALAGCDRSEKDDAEMVEVTEQETQVSENAAATAVSCDDPMVQDRLKSALKNTLNQQAQTLAVSYANDAEIGLGSGVVSTKANGIIIDIQNAAVLQATNENGLTTCQASVSMTLPSEDLYQASQVQAANNQPSLQSRLANDNIRINNNMLIDDAFTYVVGTQGGQVRTRIAGQPALLTVVSEVVASSTLQSAMKEQRAQRATQQPERRRESAQNTQSNNTTSQPRAVTPAAPVRPAQPAKPPVVNQNSSQSTKTPSSTPSAPTPSTTAPSTVTPTPAAPEAPKATPKDESIDMVIIEDKEATY